jgi:RNA polymerase sigma-70 factor (ECF subfamily)
MAAKPYLRMPGGAARREQFAFRRENKRELSLAYTVSLQFTGGCRAAPAPRSPANELPCFLSSRPAVLVGPRAKKDVQSTMATTIDPREAIRSFDQIYEEYKGALYSYLMYLLGDRELAADVTQEVFLKAWRALPRMQGPLRLSSWLYRIATNAAFDKLRRKRLIRWLPWEDLGNAPEDTDSTDPQELYDASELVRAALARMPQHYRAALLLRVQEGFSYQEIACTLNIKESGVKMYLSRARQSFREHYAVLAKA